MEHNRTIIFYHGDCPDGFGGVFAAWKRFGDSASYVALKHQRPFTVDVSGADCYFVDFCYPKEIMDGIIASAKSVTVLDHHEGNQEVVEAMPKYVYDASRSGATIAWSYFHPDAAVPRFLTIVQKADLFLPLTDEERAIVSYAYAQPFTFVVWDDLTERIENPTERATIVERGRVYTEYFKLLVSQLAERAELVSFEGHEVYLVSAPRMFATELGNLLRNKKPPLALIARIEADGTVRVSLRSTDEADVSAIARKYGGNGHPRSAAFSLPPGAALPWKPSTRDENSRD